MKKVFIYLLSIVFIISLVGVSSVMAAEGTISGTATISHNSESKSHSTVVHYGLTGNEYLVTVPPSFDFNRYEVMTGNVKVTDVRLGIYEVLNVTVQSTHSWNLVLHNGATPITSANPITYNMTAITDQFGVITTTSGHDLTQKSEKITLISVGSTETETVPVTFQLGDTENAQTNGDYKDTLTFEVSIKDINPNPQDPST